MVGGGQDKRVIEKGKRGKKKGRRKRYDCERDKTERRGNGEG